jgi:hypothetical protein
MSRWFRLYDDLVDDPKVQRLPAELFKAWVNLLCLASKGGGMLPPIEDIAFKLRVDEDRATELLSILTERGLIDAGEDGAKPHNWDGRQHKSDISTERVKRHRANNVKRDETVPVTPPDTDTDTEQKELSSAQGARDSDWPKDFRERFWNEVPKKVDKGATLRKLDAIRRSGKVRFELLLSAMRLYAKSVSGSEPRFVKSPLVWLNKGCWDDELPAETRVFAAAEPTAPPGKIYLTPENPEWIRYAQTYRAAKGHDPPVGKQGGWYFDEIKAA